MQEIQLNSVPTAIAYCPVSHDVLGQHPTRKEIFVGLADGTLHQVFLDSHTNHFGSFLTPPASEHAAAITQIYSGFDSAQDGLDDVVVGREGGKVEIYHMDSFGQLLKVSLKQFRLCDSSDVLFTQCWPQRKGIREAMAHSGLMVNKLT